MIEGTKYMSEIWDLVDKEGKKTGITWLRTDHANIPEGYFHPCVEVWVKIGDSLLITQRHPDKSEGMKFDSPGGGVLSGEEFIDGALRELCEEVGIKALAEDLKLLGAVTGRRAYAVSYLLTLDAMPEITVQPSEVVGYKLVSEAEIEKMADELCEGCRRRYFMFKNEIF